MKFDELNSFRFGDLYVNVREVWHKIQRDSDILSRDLYNETHPQATAQVLLPVSFILVNRTRE